MRTAVVGRARREPCARCDLPVFIAERLKVDGRVYHRACFCCARCSHPLSLANCYQTEGGEFCCEVCPDEAQPVMARPLSDEEKSSLAAPDLYSSHCEAALEQPLDDELKRCATLTPTATARSLFFLSHMQAETEVPADLPDALTLPPGAEEPPQEKEIVEDPCCDKEEVEDTLVVADEVKEPLGSPVQEEATDTLPLEAEEPKDIPDPAAEVTVTPPRSDSGSVAPDYPQELNPFGEEEERPVPAARTKKRATLSPPTPSNPFDEEDDEAQPLE